MADNAVAGYADALFAVAEANGVLLTVEDELFRFSQALNSDENLQATLDDSSLPVDRRQQIVEDLLEGSACPTTKALVSMVVASRRSSRFSSIVDAFIERSASSRNKTVATVRSAVELDNSQKDKLVTALSGATNKDVEVKVVIDPSVIGGLITEIGDDIIDGSVRRRLNQLRENFR